MSVSAGTLYGALPEAFKDQLKPLDVSAETYVKDFMNETVGDQDTKHVKALRQKPLMLDPLRKIRIKKKSRSTGLSAKEKRALGLFKLRKDKLKYSNLLQLHKLWADYMKNLLGLKHHTNMFPEGAILRRFFHNCRTEWLISVRTLKMVENKILKADYHGAILKVTKSKCTTYSNACGIVFKETKNMFYLVTEDDEVKGIPKNCSLFEFQLEGYVFEIFGNNFRFRPGERSARKFKTKSFLAL